MVEQKNIWKFNDDEWKVHVEDESIIKKVQEKFNIGKPGTIYYGNGENSRRDSRSALRWKQYKLIKGGRLRSQGTFNLQWYESVRLGLLLVFSLKP